MTLSTTSVDDIIVQKLDLSNWQAELLISGGVVACDLETTGLNWRTDRIAACQLHFAGGPVFIIRTGDTAPAEICRVLGSQKVRKVFHHAMFDLRFINYHWNISPTNVVCTRIAAKLIDRENQSSHSLKDILQQYLGVETSKAEQTSDWLRETLTESQIQYAATDVRFLIRLFETLETKLRTVRLDELASKCFEHLPVRVRLEILGYDDVYGYSSRKSARVSLLRKVVQLFSAR